MKHSLSNTFLKRAILLMAPFLFIACEKPSDGLGFEQVIGGTIEADSIHLPLISYTAPIDSILVALPYSDQIRFGGYNSTRLIGRTNSPYFGQEEAALIAQVLPTQVNPNFGTNPKVDSVNLFIRLTEAYGDTITPMSFEVHELKELIVKDTSYFSNFDPALGALLGRLDNYQPKPRTSNEFEGAAAPAHLRINLDTAYFQRKFADVGDGTFDSLAGFETFVNYFKGLKVSCTQGGAILYSNLASSFSLIRIYYHNDEDTTFTDLSFDQDKSVVPIILSSFSQDYTGARLDLNNQDTINGEATTYIQAMGGAVTAFKFNTDAIDSLSQEGLVINKATVAFYTAAGTGEAVAPTPRVEVRFLNGRALGDRILDFQGEANGGGVLSRTVFRDNQYEVNVTRALFEMLNRGENNTLALVPVSRTSAAHRTILRGGKAVQERARVIVYYTKP